MSFLSPSPYEVFDFGNRISSRPPFKGTSFEGYSTAAACGFGGKLPGGLFTDTAGYQGLGPLIRGVSGHYQSVVPQALVVVSQIGRR